MKNKATLIVIFLFLYIVNGIAQIGNCSVNAGADFTICPTTQFEIESFIPEVSSEFSANPNFYWEIIEQPVGASATLSDEKIDINTPSFEAILNGLIIPGDYIYRFCVNSCEDGTIVCDEAIITITPNPPATMQVVDFQSCSNTITLSGNAPATGGSFEWIYNTGWFDGVESGNQITLTLKDQYPCKELAITYKLIAGECSNEITEYFNLINTDVPIDAGDDGEICMLSKQLEATYFKPCQEGIWTVVSTPLGAAPPVFADVTLPNSDVMVTKAGTYQFEWCTTGCVTGCDIITMTFFEPFTEGNSTKYNFCTFPEAVPISFETVTIPDPTTDTNVYTGVDGITTTETITTTYSLYDEELTHYDCIEIVSNDLAGNLVVDLSNCDETPASCERVEMSYSIECIVNTHILTVDDQGMVINEENISESIICPDYQRYSFCIFGEANFVDGTLPCGVTTTSLYDFRTGSSSGYFFSIISEPVGSTAEIDIGIISNLIPGDYTILAEPKINDVDFDFTFEVNADECLADKTFTITVSGEAEPISAGSDQYLCENETSTYLIGTPVPYSTYSGQWTQVDDNPLVTFSDPTSNAPLISQLVFGNTYTFQWDYVVPGFQGTCNNSDIVSIFVLGDCPAITGDCSNININFDESFSQSSDINLDISVNTLDNTQVIQSVNIDYGNGDIETFSGLENNSFNYQFPLEQIITTTVTVSVEIFDLNQNGIYTCTDTYVYTTPANCYIDAPVISNCEQFSTSDGAPLGTYFYWDDLLGVDVYEVLITSLDVDCCGGTQNGSETILETNQTFMEIPANYGTCGSVQVRAKCINDDTYSDWSNKMCWSGGCNDTSLTSSCEDMIIDMGQIPTVASSLSLKAYVTMHNSNPELEIIGTNITWGNGQVTNNIGDSYSFTHEYINTFAVSQIYNINIVVTLINTETGMIYYCEHSNSLTLMSILGTDGSCPTPEDPYQPESEFIYDSVQVVWDRVKQASMYEVSLYEGSIEGCLTRPRLLKRIKTRKNSLNITDLDRKKCYSWTIRTVCESIREVKYSRETHLQPIKFYKKMHSNLIKYRKIEEPLLKVYPNPTSNMLYIDIDNSINIEAPIKVKLINKLGVKVLERELNQHQNIQHLGDLMEGLYFLQYRIHNNYYTQKVFITN